MRAGKDRAAYGPTFGPIGLVETWRRPGPTSTTGHRSGRVRVGAWRPVWFNIGGETCATLNLGEDGTIALVAGTPDTAARGPRSAFSGGALGVDVERIRPLIGDTSTLGYTLPHRRQPDRVRERHGVIEASKA